MPKSCPRSFPNEKSSLSLHWKEKIEDVEQSIGEKVDFESSILIEPVYSPTECFDKIHPTQVGTA